jgi:anthranilate/para-aminobenzoate synthase component I
VAAATLVRQVEIDTVWTPAELCRAGYARSGAAAWFDGTGPFGGDGWLQGPLVALQPVAQPLPHAPEEGLGALARLVETRRARGGPAETGLAVLAGYELFAATSLPPSAAPRLVALAVDRSVRFLGGGRVRLTGPDLPLDRARRALDVAPRGRCDASPAPARATAAAGTSLPRARYLAAVERLLHHIREGDVYQANLCQRFEVRYAGDPLALYVELSSAAPAPRSAFVATAGLALASLSPETFLRVRLPGRIETLPIKGTRPRGATAAEDRDRAEQLLRSPKDRAELLMIVDLERNDLSRVCRAGTVRVAELVRLRSYAAVHHLEARVQGELREGVGVDDLLRATFPGGSISGAPKRRAMEILGELEPVRRGFFTGSLLWFGDDGRVDSSILIRTLTFGRERAWLGAGGGIVADSSPEREWEESNHKARLLARGLGFEPEQAR